MKNYTEGLTVGQRILYRITYGLFALVSLLPLGLLYICSDMLCVLVYRIVRYRRKVVWRNLTACFPDKPEAELRATERRFYHFLCDYFFETIKLATMSQKEMRRRMRFEGLELFDEAFAKGQSVSLMLGHYCNWEWVSSLGIHIPEGSVGGQIYHPLENVVMDRVFLRLRERFRVNCIDRDDTLQTLVRWKREGRVSITGYIADQVPGFQSMHYWTPFLNHDTSFFSGAERITRVIGASVMYVDMERPKRGYYTGRIKVMLNNVASVPRFHATELYVRELEKTICRQPEFWLWSHNRWKRTREDFERVFSEKAVRRITGKL